MTSSALFLGFGAGLVIGRGLLVADKTGKGRWGEGRLLLGHGTSKVMGPGTAGGSFEGPARLRQPISGPGRPRELGVSGIS
jgi:hypothetical protein